MKTIKIIILIFLCLRVSAQKPILLKAQEYLMPENDTMDVICIPYAQVENYTMDVGKYSRIEPVPVDTLNPTGMHFLPHRCLYDPDMISIRSSLNTLTKRYLIITQKKLVTKPGQIEP